MAEARLLYKCRCCGVVFDNGTCCGDGLARDLLVFYTSRGAEGVALLMRDKIGIFMERTQHGCSGCRSGIADFCGYDVRPNREPEAP